MKLVHNFSPTLELWENMSMMKLVHNFNPTLELWEKVNNEIGP